MAWLLKEMVLMCKAVLRLPFVDRYFIGRFFQLTGLVMTTYSLVIFFGDTWPMLKMAAIGITIFYLGWLIAGKPA
jgi:hypothetical protein